MKKDFSENKFLRQSPKQNIDEIIVRYQNWQYKNTFLLLLSIGLFIYFAKTPALNDAINFLGGFGFLSAIFAGVLFVSAFTVVPATVILFDLASQFNPWLIAILAGFGAVVGDYLIFRFIKNNIFDELRPLFINFGWSKLFAKLFLTPYFSWLLPIAGAAIIASPFPDELGLTILGISKVKMWQFLLITFVLNSIGILIIISAARIF